MPTKEFKPAQDLRTALGPILHCNGTRWFRYVMGIVRNEADAQDVLQEAVRRVLARNQPLPSREDIRMYLGRAVGNAALEFYNNRKRERLRQIPIHERISVPDKSFGPYEKQKKKEKAEEMERLLGLVRQGLALLPCKQYEALRLTIMESEGLSIRDVGSISGIPYSTLRHRSKQGLRRLRRYVERAMRLKGIPGLGNLCEAKKSSSRPGRS